MEEFLGLLEIVLNTFEVGHGPQTFLALVGLAFARLLSFLIIVPFFGGASVPSRVKVATAFAFVIIVYPTLAASAPAGVRLPFGAIGFAALLVKEAFVGFTLGFVAMLIFEAIQVAGRLIDTQRGSSMNELFAPQLQTRVSELGLFKLQFAIVVFLAIGAHRFFIEALLRSFEVIPATGFPRLDGGGWTPLGASITTLTSQVLLIGVQLAAPALVALLLTDLMFGIINRVAPQINVFFLSMPIKMFVGVFVVLLALQLYKDRYIYYFGENLEAFRDMIRLISAISAH